MPGKKNKNSKSHNGKSTKSGQQQNGSKTSTRSGSTARRRKFHFKVSAVLIVLISVSFAGIAAYKRNWGNLTDLSVIGNGIPVVVQVHDPSCPKCRKLKSNTQSALSRLDLEIQYRIADLSSGKGRRIANEYDAGKVTLLAFNSEGQYLNKYTGVRSVASLEALFKRIANGGIKAAARHLK